MGKAKIFTLPTSIARKQAGQFKKRFGLWGNGKTRDPVQRELDPPAAVMKEGLPNFLSQSRGLRNTFVTRRQIALNRHFTEIVSDVLAQEFKTELDELNVTITSIETKAWNKGLCIFYTTGRSYDDEIHRDLNKMIPDILRSVTDRRLIGRTPRASFVHDRTIDFDKTLSEALSKIRLEEEGETQLAKMTSTQLYISKDLGDQEPKLISKRFMAPNDMDNTLFGLDYPLLYDEVALRLSRGRGESSRLKSTVNVLTEAKPLFRAPREDYNEEDPMTRIMRMQKFIISQKQKSENLARSRRKAEIYARNSVKWQIVDEDDQPLDKDEVTA